MKTLLHSTKLNPTKPPIKTFKISLESPSLRRSAARNEAEVAPRYFGPRGNINPRYGQKRKTLPWTTKTTPGRRHSQHPLKDEHCNGLLKKTKYQAQAKPCNKIARPTAAWRAWMQRNKISQKRRKFPRTLIPKTKKPIWIKKMNLKMTKINKKKFNPRLTILSDVDLMIFQIQQGLKQYTGMPKGGNSI